MSKIEQFKIYNYKSIKELVVDLNKNLNIFVGPNNSGKTNIINAIFEGLNVKSSNTPYTSISRIDNFERKKVKAIFSTFEKGKIIYNEDSYNNSVKYLKPDINPLYDENAKRSISKNIKVAKVDNNTTMEQSMIEIVDFLDGLEDDEMSSVLSNINKDLMVLSKQFYSLSIFNNRIFVADSYGDTAPISEKSNGVKKLVIMSYWINKYNIKNSELPDIILFDEPEVHLHIEAQRYLYKKIKESFTESQIIISTHSTAFINETDINNIYLVDRDVMRGTFIDFKNEDKVKLLKINEIMGINLLDTLKIDVNATVVMVEGKTDKNVHNFIYHKLFPKKKLTFIEIEGANKITDFISVYKEVFPTPPLGILDYDSKGLSLIKKIKDKFDNIYNYRIILNNNEFIESYEGNENVSDEKSIQVEDLFEKDFIITCIKKLLTKDGVIEYFDEILKEYKNFKLFEKVIKSKNIKIKGFKYSINKYSLNIIIMQNLQILDKDSFIKVVTNFEKLYDNLNKNK
ncbi:AAA family ATPase [Staphylococcus sp. GDX8P107P-1]|uniref:ATP-dependent nuclease n=1 Tax=Staphylococcus sp. GDX8P107P-1 TaxID=2804109 RepID=UPI001AEC2941|nr:AAA family ATPase [Staphylococcus sp. GDX8P107P-1]